MTIQKEEQKNEFHQSVQDAEYWRLMYDELEDQMYKMMKLTVDLLEKEAPMDERTYKRIKELELDLRKYKLFEHRVKVTWLGKLTLKYINFKKKLKSIIK
ncbi:MULTISPECIES: hypothetical protein [Gracilibacillus]|uniref:Uncharacterized protein n=1 Tax=Gracilibacillus dipsosauri TaxID=178340 RepID=A0A317KUP2_9BACI|nr:hypothetical protein [Gracilibacillus dipsosauri]PWU67135.1 hypothetical protein DLJ74_16280 [Gracilibacillus dipsosauri]